MIIRLIHGIHSPEGNNNITAFAPVLQHALPGARIEIFSYGFMGFWQARWHNDEVAHKLAHVKQHNTGEKEIWVTHSNGAAIAYLAVTKYYSRPNAIFNFNPALDRWRVAPVSHVETIHSAQDRWVDLARFLPLHIWGDQGKVGIKATPYNKVEHDRYVCHDATKIPGSMSYKSHCGAFSQSRRQDWAYFLANRFDEILPRI